MEVESKYIDLHDLRLCSARLPIWASSPFVSKRRVGSWSSVLIIGVL